MLLKSATASLIHLRGAESTNRVPVVYFRTFIQHIDRNRLQKQLTRSIHINYLSRNTGILQRNLVHRDSRKNCI